MTGSARRRGRIFTALAIACLLGVGISGADSDDFTSAWDGRTFVAHGPAFPDGQWQVRADAVPTGAEPGDRLSWLVHFEMKSSALRKFGARVEQVRLALAARRVCDADGHYRDQNGYFTSTYLTPGGLPIEGYQYLIANSRVGGPYRTPLDVAVDAPRDALRFLGDGLSFSLPVDAPLAPDFPAGLYRIEMAFFASVGGHWIPLHALGAADLELPGGCDPDYEQRYFYQKILLPPLRVGKIKRPRMIWTLFGELRSNGVSGVVANEDAPYFAMSNRIKPQTRYVLPCQPDRQECVFRLGPDLPTVAAHRSKIFFSKEYGGDTLDLDYAKGEVAIRVTRPDGRTDDLGTHAFNGRGAAGPEIKDRKTRYRFDQFGKYEIHMSGDMADRFGNRFQAGGTYEVWVAYPLTFATAIKPGTPLKVGDAYPVAATINPPVPAAVTAVVRFFPGLRPHETVETVYAGTAQKFGYFFPDPAQRPFVFPEPGEYALDLFAVYTAPSGRVYMGNLKNASVVAPAEETLTIVGGNQRMLPRAFDALCAFDEIYCYNSTIYFPHDSGKVFRFFGNSAPHQIITPNMAVEEPSGFLQQAVDRSFPAGLVKLDRASGDGSYTATHAAFLPGSQDMLRVCAEGRGSGKYLPLMSTTTAGYSPFEYSELVDRRGYFYIAASRPGFPAYFVVASSAINENYWSAGGGDYAGTIGAAKRGDQPGDIYWSVVGGLFADGQAKRDFYGEYGAAGIAAPRGDLSIFDDAAKAPIATVNGVNLEFYGGVGPAPGTIYETGAVKGVGSIAVPMTAHDVEIRVVKPDGQTLDCRGRADRIGNFFCPDGSLVYDQPGVYRIFARFAEGAAVGTVPGARAGWYRTYAVAKDTPYRVLFDGNLLKPVAFDEALNVAGQVEPPLRSGRVYYSVVAPGILIDEGAVDLSGGRFGVLLLPDQIGAEFANLHDHPSIVPLKFGGFPTPRGLAELWQSMVGHKRRALSDTVEITIFVEGVDADGKPATAGGKFVLRGSRVMIPDAFLAPETAGRR